MHNGSGDTLFVSADTGLLTGSFARSGRYEAAAVLFASDSSVTAIWVPEISAVVAHLRDLLGAAEFDRLTGEGAAMDRVEAVRYAHEQIQLAREDLDRQVEQPSIDPVQA